MTSKTVPPCLFAALLALALAACDPVYDDNFANLSLDQQVQVYAEHLRTHFGMPSDHARALISWHGWQAADLMAKYVDGSKTGLPRYEALEIIDLVQVRGCSLKNTAAEKSVAAFLTKAQNGSLEALVASYTLENIRNNTVMLNLNEIRGGVCQPNAHP